jgi:hypothetical protein
VGTEHALLSLVGAERGIAMEVLADLGVTRERTLATSCMRANLGAPAGDDCLPVMPRYKQALEHSRRIAYALGARTADAEHLVRLADGNGGYCASTGGVTGVRLGPSGQRARRSRGRSPARRAVRPARTATRPAHDPVLHRRGHRLRPAHSGRRRPRRPEEIHLLAILGLVLLRREVAKEVDALQERWREGPIGAPPRPRRRLRGSSPIFTVRPSDADAVVGHLDAPERVLAKSVAARLRVRRDRPGALVALEDGRYAVTGPLLIAGSRDDVTAYARRRAESADPDDRAWLQTVVGALAIDIFDAATAARADPIPAPD